MVVLNSQLLVFKPSGHVNCFYCGIDLNKGKTYDHVDPKSRAGMGANLPVNLKFACKPCNSEKGCMTLEQYRLLKTLQLLTKFLKKYQPITIKRFKFYGEIHPERCNFQFRKGNHYAEEGKQPQELRCFQAVAGV